MIESYGAVIIDDDPSKVQPEPWLEPWVEERPKAQKLGGEGNHTDPGVSCAPTPLKHGKYGLQKRTDRNFPKAGISANQVCGLLARLQGCVGRYDGTRPRESEHADNIVIGCVCLLDQIPGIDANGWFHRRQPGTRRRRCDILRNVAKRPHGKDQKAALLALLTYTESAIAAAAPFLPTPNTGALPLTWRL